MILGFLFHGKNIFWICFSSSITEFRIVVNKAKCTIFEMVKDLKIVIFPFKISFLIHHSLITLTMFLIESQKFKSSRSFGLENLYTYIFMVSLVRSIFFILQSATLKSFSTPIPAISHLITSGGSSENLEKLSRR